MEQAYETQHVVDDVDLALTPTCYNERCPEFGRVNGTIKDRLRESPFVGVRVRTTSKAR
jgi:hypothetical protein